MLRALSPAARAAYHAGRQAVIDRDDTNPYIEEREPELYHAWDEGYAFELDAQAQEICGSTA